MSSHTRRGGSLWRAVSAIVVVATCGSASAQVREIVSVATGGRVSNGNSCHPAISADGSVIAFASLATKLEEGVNDSDGTWDVFARDRVAGTTKTLSVDAKRNRSQAQPAGQWGVAISGNGRYVSFETSADLSRDRQPPLEAANLYLVDLDGDPPLLISRSPTGDVGDGLSSESAIDHRGDFVAFRSAATNLVPSDENARDDIFLWDRQQNRIRRISVPSGGETDDSAWGRPAISADAARIAFETFVDGLDPRDLNNHGDVYVYQRTRHPRHVLASVGPPPPPGEKPAIGDGWSTEPDVSADGKVVAFRSRATNLIDPIPAARGASQVYVRDLVAGRTTCVSVSSTREMANLSCFCPSMSGDGRFVVFDSGATNLVPDDTNGWADVFVHDRFSGKTAVVSRPDPHTESNKTSREARISADGNWIAFTSWATNLVTHDTNGRADVFLAENPLRNASPPPTLACVGTLGYEADGCEPNVGDALTTKFVFKILLTSPSGLEPDSVDLLLYRDGKLKRRTPMIPAPTSTASGRRYVKAQTLEEGNWSYRFEAHDAGGYAVWPEGDPCFGPVVPTRPYLAWAGMNGWTSDGVHPDAGDVDPSRFRFKVKYIAHDGAMPQYVRLFLRRDGQHHARITMRTSDTAPDPTSGIIYKADAKLPVGSYQYKFTALDETGDSAFGAPRNWTGGPVVSNSAGTLVVSSFYAAPTAAGALVEFRLSSAATVDVRAMNMAGRPVASLCRGKSFDAGASRLHWSAVSDTGLRVPAGSYIIEVTAREPGGQSVRALSQVLLDRR